MMQSLAEALGYGLIYGIGAVVSLGIICIILDCIIGFFSCKTELKTEIARLRDEMYYLKKDIGYDKIKAKIEKQKGENND